MRSIARDAVDAVDDAVGVGVNEVEEGCDDALVVREDSSSLLERFDRRSFKGEKWGKKTGNTLKYCPRCFQSKTSQGFIGMPYNRNVPSLSLKKKGRWRIVDAIEQNEVCDRNPNPFFMCCC